MGMFLKKATIENCELIFRWANDEFVRKNSFNSSQINFQDHINWFRSKINSPDCFLFVCYDGQNPVGQIRIDVEEDVGIINYMVDGQFRGMGYGTEFLKSVVNEMKKSGAKISKLIGKTKIDNIASRKAFEKAGYISQEFDNYIEYHIDI